ncbi:MAG: neuromedin U [Acidobacteriota bacterium]|jgi:hypothetical protein
MATGTSGSIRGSVCGSVFIALLLASATALPARAFQQTPPAPVPTTGDEHSDLAKQVQNPFADMILFPLQDITGIGIGPDAEGNGNELNIQPVFPIRISEGWNLLMRPVLPVAYTSVPESAFGLGDLDLEPFLSPISSSSVTWGVGPIVGIPTATDDAVGTGKWTIGPSFAVFAHSGPWAFSMIANQQWDYAGDSARDSVSLLQLQPSLSYILGNGWFITSGPLISADWTQPAGQQWVVPLGAGVGRVVSLGQQKVNLQAEFYGNVVHPDEGPEKLLILTLTLLFPR